MAETAPIDANDVKGLMAASSADGKTPVRVWADPDSHRLLVDLGSGVVGPGLSTDKAVVRWEGTTGETIQNSLVIIDNSGNVSTPGTIASPTIDALVPYTGAIADLDLGTHSLVFTTASPITKVYVDGEMNPENNLSFDVASFKSFAVTNNGVGSAFFSTIDHTADILTGFNPAAAAGAGVSLKASGVETLVATNAGVTIIGNTDSTTFSADGTPAVTDGTYTVGNRITPVTGDLGTITVKGGIIIAIQEAS